MTSRTWADGPTGNTPMTAAAMNGIEADLDARVQTWKAAVTYAAGQPVVSPSGDLVTGRPVTVLRTNLATNPSPATATGWNTSFGSGAGTTTYGSVSGFTSAGAGTNTFTTAPTGGWSVQAGPFSGITAGQSISASMSGKHTWAGGMVGVTMQFFDASSTSLGYFSATKQSVAANTLTVLSHTATAPVSATRVSVFWDANGGTYPAVNDVAVIGASLIEQSSTVGTYFDGSTPASGGLTYAWTGTANASTSTQSNLPNFTSGATYTAANWTAPPAVAAKLDKTSAAGTYALLTRPATALPIWLRKRTLAQLGQSPVRVLCIGDSTTAGIYSDSYTTATGSVNQGGPNSYPAQLAKRLTAAGIPAEYSFCLPGHSGNDDSRWALGTWSYAAYGAGMNGTITSTTAAQSCTVTPTNTANSYIVYYYGDGGTGVFTAQATGGTSVSINTVNGTAGIHASAVVTASATASTNTITFTNTSGTVFICGVEAYDSANPNKVRIMGAGVGGSKATDWSNTGGPGALNFIKGIAPDVAVISLGVNDGAAGETTATVQTAVDAVEAAVAVTGDVVLMSAVPHNASSVLDGYNAAYKAEGKPYVDLQARWGYSGQTMQFITTDNTHPNAIGYGDMASAVAQLLLTA